MKTGGWFWAVAACILVTVLSPIPAGRSAFAVQEPAPPAPAPEQARVTFRTGETTNTVDGEVLVAAADGGLLVKSADQRIWMIQPDQLVSREPLAEPQAMLDGDQLEKLLLGEMPANFRVESTRHFVIVYNCDRMFAKWVGNLYEKLLRGYLDWWKKKHGYELDSPTVPLVVLVFATFGEYSDYVQKELGQPPGTMVAYYSLMSNRVALYDLTAGLGGTAQGSRNISEIVSSRGAVEMVTTIIHEGTHQLMFNTGMQTRFADTPLWVNEGMAMFFETPDASNPQGFRAIGQLNLLRLNQFLLWARSRAPDSLEKLLGDDSVLREGDDRLGRYAEAWAFNYFLLQRHGRQYVAYLKHLAAKPVMQYATASQRLDDFRLFFEMELDQLDREFLEFMATRVK